MMSGCIIFILPSAIKSFRGSGSSHKVKWLQVVLPFREINLKAVRKFCFGLAVSLRSMHWTVTSCVHRNCTISLQRICNANVAFKTL